MRNRMKRSATLAALLAAAVAATAWAANGTLHDSTWVPYRATVDTSVVTAQSLGPNEAIVTDEPAPFVQPAPVAERVMPLEAAALPSQRMSAPQAGRTQAPIVIEQRRLTLDESIQARLMDAIAQAPNISGRIGVESHDAVVTLSGWTLTQAQAQRAVRHAYATGGVRDVRNEIRARVGGPV